MSDDVDNRVIQTGTVSPRHAAIWTTDGVIEDGGTSAESKLTSLGITAAGDTPFAINDAPVTGPYSAFSLGINPTNGALISVDSFNGAQLLGLHFRINGNLSDLFINPDGTASVAAGGPFLQLVGGITTGPVSLFGNATQPLEAVPLQQLNAATAGGPFLPLATGGTVTGATVFSGSGRALDVLTGTARFQIPDTTHPVIITANPAATPAIQGGTLLQLTGLDANFPRITMDAFGAFPILAFRAASGTFAAPTALILGNALGSLFYYGYDGSAYSGSRASLIVNADATWTSTSHPTRFVWATTAIGSTAVADRMWLNNAGNLLLGNSFTDTGWKMQVHQGAISAPITAQNFYTQTDSVSGTTASSVYFNAMRVLADTSTTPSNLLLGLTYGFGGAGFTGQATGLNVNFTLNANSNPSADNVYYTAVNITPFANANAGGTNTTTGSKGQFYGLNITQQLSAGATNFEESTSAEIDSAVVAGASVSRRTNLKLILQGGHAVQGTVHDSILQFGRGVSATAGSLLGLTIGTVEGIFPIDNTNGIAIGHTYCSIAVAGVNPQLKSFIDVSHIRALTAHWLSPGASIDGSGNRTIGPASLAWSAAGASLDVFGQTGGTPTINSGGVGAITGQIVTTGNGDLYTATASAGAITALTVIVAATSRTTGPTGAQTLLGDGISGATCTIPWSNARALALQPGGGTIQVGSGCIAANGSVATVLGSLGPAGSNTTVQEWMAVKNASGVTRYIPCF